MYTFNVPDMSCGHCVKTINEALKTLDAGAQITIDLQHKTVVVQSGLDETEIKKALTEAGYPPAN